MSLSDKIKIQLESRSNNWTATTLPGVHFEFVSDMVVNIVFDGHAVSVHQTDIDPRHLGQTLGQRVFEDICYVFSVEGYGSYSDAKLIAEKVALKAERLDQMKVWIVQGR